MESSRGRRQTLADLILFKRSSVTPALSCINSDKAFDLSTSDDNSYVSDTCKLQNSLSHFSQDNASDSELSDSSVPSCKSRKRVVFQDDGSGYSRRRWKAKRTKRRLSLAATNSDSPSNLASRSTFKSDFNNHDSSNLGAKNELKTVPATYENNSHNGEETSSREQSLSQMAGVDKDNNGTQSRRFISRKVRRKFNDRNDEAIDKNIRKEMNQKIKKETRLVKLTSNDSETKEMESHKLASFHHNLEDNTGKEIDGQSNCHEAQTSTESVVQLSDDTVQVDSVITSENSQEMCNEIVNTPKGHSVQKLISSPVSQNGQMTFIFESSVDNIENEQHLLKPNNNISNKKNPNLLPESLNDILQEMKGSSDAAIPNSDTTKRRSSKEKMIKGKDTAKRSLKELAQTINEGLEEEQRLGTAFLTAVNMWRDSAIIRLHLKKSNIIDSVIEEHSTEREDFSTSTTPSQSVTSTKKSQERQLQSHDLHNEIHLRHRHQSNGVAQSSNNTQSNDKQTNGSKPFTTFSSSRIGNTIELSENENCKKTPLSVTREAEYNKYNSGQANNNIIVTEDTNNTVTVSVGQNNDEELTSAEDQVSVAEKNEVEKKDTLSETEEIDIRHLGTSHEKKCPQDGVTENDNCVHIEKVTSNKRTFQKDTKTKTSNEGVPSDREREYMKKHSASKDYKEPFNTSSVSSKASKAKQIQIVIRNASEQTRSTVDSSIKIIIKIPESPLTEDITDVNHDITASGSEFDVNAITSNNVHDTKIAVKKENRNDKRSINHPTIERAKTDIEINGCANNFSMKKNSKTSPLPSIRPNRKMRIKSMVRKTSFTRCIHSSSGRRQMLVMTSSNMAEPRPTSVKIKEVDGVLCSNEAVFVGRDLKLYGSFEAASNTKRVNRILDEVQLLKQGKLNKPKPPSSVTNFSNTTVWQREFLNNEDDDALFLHAVTSLPSLTGNINRNKTRPAYRRRKERAYSQLRKKLSILS